MSHRDHLDLPAMPLPSPWVMGVVTLGAGITLCWLAATAGCSEGSRWEGRPNGVRTYFETTWALGGAVMVVLGFLILGAAIASM